MTAARESPDLVIAKRLLDHAKRRGFQFQPVEGGQDGALLGTRDRYDFVDIVFIAGFSRDCYALRRRTTSLLVPGGGVVELRTTGDALNVLNSVLTWPL
jgi:hypothetical protein